LTRDDTPLRRFQLSIRTLMLGSAIVAVLLVPVAWVARERQQMLSMRDEILRAREVAMASVIREEEARARQAVAQASSPSVEELKRKNAELRSQVESLKREIRTLRDRPEAEPPIGPGATSHR